MECLIAIVQNFVVVQHRGSVSEVVLHDVDHRGDCLRLCTLADHLDLYEGYPNYYRKEDLNIELLREGAEPEMVTAMVYIMENDFGHRAPSRYYYKVLHDGYKAFHFPMHILEGALKECMDKDAAQRMIEEVQA